MKGLVPVVAVLGLVMVLGALKRRQSRRPSGTLSRLRENVEDALADAETRTEELRRRAKKLSGDARRALQDEAQEMERRQHELRARFDELKQDAVRLLERGKAS